MIMTCFFLFVDLCRIPVVRPILSHAGMDVASTNRNAGGSTSIASASVPSACSAAPSTSSDLLCRVLRVPTENFVKREMM